MFQSLLGVMCCRLSLLPPLTLLKLRAEAHKVQHTSWTKQCTLGILNIWAGLIMQRGKASGLYLHVKQQAWDFREWLLGQLWFPVWQLPNHISSSASEKLQGVEVPHRVHLCTTIRTIRPESYAAHACQVPEMAKNGLKIQQNWPMHIYIGKWAPRVTVDSPSRLNTKKSDRSV